MTGFRFVAVLLAALLMAAGAGAQQMGEDEVRFGRIERIDPVSLDGDHHLGLGMVLGAVAGGVLGHQFGGGTGRDRTMLPGRPPIGAAPGATC
jgi:outer membrane lipoprotein SlyB